MDLTRPKRRDNDIVSLFDKLLDALEMGTSQGVSVDDVYEAVNAVAPSLIRVEAYELTYPLHAYFILRYGIEDDVIAGDLVVADIPQRWNDDMQRRLGRDRPPNHANVCMQDVHWHCHGMPYKSLDVLLEDQLGEKLNPQHFIEDLETKYSAIPCVSVKAIVFGPIKS
jgi:Zn-dependent M32 family carboxypeptidase